MSNILVAIPEAPPIPGLMFRTFQGEVDYPVIVDLMNRCNIHDDLDILDTVEDVAVRFAHPSNYDPYQDVLLAEVNGEVVSYSQVFWSNEADERVYSMYWYLPPEWRDVGIERAMQAHCERRIRQIASQHPTVTKRVMQTWAYASEEYLIHTLEPFGYERVRYFYKMTRPIEIPLPDAPMPEGLEVRPVKPDQMRAIWDAKNEAFRDHWGYGERTEADYQRWLESPIYDPQLWKVAWDGNQVAGMVLNYIHAEENEKLHRLRGYTETISVRRPWRRKGLARALLAESIRMFKEMGMEETALGVDTENANGALDLYAGMGYETKKVIYTYRKPF